MYRTLYKFRDVSLFYCFCSLNFALFPKAIDFRSEKGLSIVFAAKIMSKVLKHNSSEMTLTLFTDRTLIMHQATFKTLVNIVMKSFF